MRLLHARVSSWRCSRFITPRRAQVDRSVVNDFIAGNLCRCTGYRPITDAGLAACADGAADRFTAQEGDIRNALAALDDGADLMAGTQERFFAAPASIEALAALYAAHPDAVLVGGATDVGLWITKQLRDLPKIIWLGHVQGLDAIEDAEDAVTFGAMVTHETALPHLAAIDPDLGELMRRFASVQIRTGTIGGNIANGSPIGDTPPALIALGGTLTLQRGGATRTLPLEDFFIAYGKQDRKPGEFVRAVRVPKLGPNDRFPLLKISKRFRLRTSRRRWARSRSRSTIRASHPPALRSAAWRRRRSEGSRRKRPCAGSIFAAPKPGTRRLRRSIRISRPSPINAPAPIIAAPLLARCWARRSPRSPEHRHRARASSVSGRTPMRPLRETAEIEPPLRVVRVATAHDSAIRHVSGSATYVDDIREPEGTLHVAPGGALRSRRLKRVDLNAVRAAPGVVAVLTAADIPGENNVGPVKHDDPIFAEEMIEFHNQVVFAVVAETREAARRAVLLAKIEMEPETPLVTVDDALSADTHVLPDSVFVTGDSAAALAASAHRLAGTMRIGGQEQFYLEGQVSLAIPGEDDILIHTSSQHPSEVQHLIAHALDLPVAAVTVEVRRMGGGFGGKETQAAQWAAIAALAARKTGRPCKMRLDRDDDMVMTGKRHDFRADFEVGFDDTGMIRAYDVCLASRCGYSVDLSGGINDRAMFHAENGYFLPAAKILSKRMKTNTVSNTAFRGFGGPQGMMAIERAIDGSPGSSASIRSTCASAIFTARAGISRLMACRSPTTSCPS